MKHKYNATVITPHRQRITQIVYARWRQDAIQRAKSIHPNVPQDAKWRARRVTGDNTR